MFILLVRITSKSPTVGEKAMNLVGLLLVILTSSINIPVIYLLVLLAIYLQIDIYPGFIYKLILFPNWV